VAPVRVRSWSCLLANQVRKLGPRKSEAAVEGVVDAVMRLLWKQRHQRPLRLLKQW
jgi:hypothetical protein